METAFFFCLRVLGGLSTSGGGASSFCLQRLGGRSKGAVGLPTARLLLIARVLGFDNHPTKTNFVFRTHHFLWFQRIGDYAPVGGVPFKTGSRAPRRRRCMSVDRSDVHALLE
jgi:hypothetical protein